MVEGSLLKDSSIVIKLGIGVLIGLAVITTIQNTNITNINGTVNTLNVTATAFRTALALFGTFVTIFVVFSVAKPLLKGFGGKN